MKEIACSPAGVEVAFSDGVEGTREVLPLEQVRGTLRKRPMALRMGERVAPGGNPFRWVGTVSGVALLVLGLLIVLRSRPSRSGTATMEEVSSDAAER